MTYQQKMRPAFYRLHAVTLNPATTVDDLTAALRGITEVQDRHRLSEGAVYASACRRYLLTTGTTWAATNRTTGDTTWAGSDHRSRLTADTWACSCGARGTSGDPEAAHTAHTAQVPA